MSEFDDSQKQWLQGFVSGIEAQIETLRGYRKSLIHECVTGQRRLTEEDLRRAGCDRSACAVERCCTT